MASYKHLRLGTSIRVRLAGRAAGLDREDILTVLDAVRDDREFGDICAAFERSTGTRLPSGSEGQEVGAAGDFLKWLLEWLSSPEGQAFIKFIFSLFGFVI